MLKPEIRGLATGLALLALALVLLISRDVGIPGQSLLQSLRFHIGLACLALPLVLLLSGAPWRALAIALALVASVGEGGWLLWQQFQRRDLLADRPVAGSLEVVSFNLLNGNPRGAELADYILAEAADIVVTMESSSLLPHLDRLAALYPERIGCSTAMTCDTAIFSRLPLSNTRVSRFGSFQRERLLVAETEIGGQRVTIVAVHLTKPYFDELADVELNILAEGLSRIEGPMILAGDFNAAAWSDALVRLAGRLDLVPPPALPATWPVRAGDFGVPIDNIFTRGDALIDTIAEIPDALGSNHRGLVARVNVLLPAAD